MKLRYNQLLYASTEKSLVTSRAGFGIRTLSNGIDGAEAERVNTLMRLNINVDLDRRPTLEQMRTNPEALEKIPPVFSFKKLAAGDGKAYAVGRSTYIAADYGFFSGNEAFQRVGSNYVAHTLVFDTLPPPQVFRLALARDVFLPHNRRVSPDNAELVALVSGEPTPLPVGELDVADLAAIAVPVDERVAHIAIALIEARRYRAKHPDNPMGVVIKAWADDTPELIAALSVLPAELTADISLLSGYNKGGMPIDFNVVMVDQTCTDIPDVAYNISVNMMDVVDAEGHYPVTNIEFNQLYNHLIDIASGGDALMLNKFALLCMTTDADRQDLDMVIKLFTMCNSAEPLAVDDLESARLSAILSAMQTIPAQEQTRVLNRLSDAVDSSLCSRDERRCVNALKAMQTIGAGRVTITDDARLAVRNALFDEVSPRLSQWAGSVGVKTLIDVIKPVERVPYHRFVAAMSGLTGSDTWREMLAYFFGDALSTSASTVVPMLLGSSLSDKVATVERLYPRASYADEVLSVLPGVDDNAKPAVAELLTAYVNSWFTDSVTEPTAELLDKVADCGVELPQSAATRLAILRQVVAGEVPETAFSRQVIKLARRRGSDDEYMTRLLERWVSFRPDVDDVAQVVNELSTARQPALIAQVLASVWHNTTDKHRGEVMRDLLDMLKWDAAVRDAVARRLSADKDNAAVVKAIEDSSTLLSALKRTVRGFFFK